MAPLSEVDRASKTPLLLLSAAECERLRVWREEEARRVGRENERGERLGRGRERRGGAERRDLVMVVVASILFLERERDWEERERETEGFWGVLKRREGHSAGRGARGRESSVRLVGAVVKQLRTLRGGLPKSLWTVLVH